LIHMLQTGTQAPDEIIVVDNDTARNIDFEHRCVERGAAYIHAGRGLDLAGARNAGWHAATGDLAVFIDDDNEVDAEFVNALARAASAHPEWGLIAPVIFGDNRTDVWCAGIRRSMRTTRTRFLNGETAIGNSSEAWPTDDAPDAFAVRVEVLRRIGGFDQERFPFHYDEADLCQRVRAAGYDTVVLATARAFHRIEKIAGPGDEMVRSYRLSGARRVALTVRARIFFHRRYSLGADRLLALAVFIPLYLAVAVADCARYAQNATEYAATANAMLRGAVEGYTG
jgi:GT2 family glycosyltransferase